jgi:hypothetical protein
LKSHASRVSLPAGQAAGACAFVFAALLVSGAPTDHPPAELLGLWRGSSQCTDRVAAPACNDEEVVYTFTAGATPGAVLWKADKMVDGMRETMGDALDTAWDVGDRCWKAEFRSSRVHVVWCFTVRGGDLAGSAWLLPGKQTVRRVDARRVTSAPGRPSR